MSKRIVTSFVLAAIVLGAPIARAAGGRPGTNGQVCYTAPVTTPGATVHVGGQQVHVPSVSKLTVCVNYGATVEGAPTVTSQPGCGSPCYTVEVRSIKVLVDVRVTLSFYMDKNQQTIGPIGVGPVDVGRDLDRICVGITMTGEDVCSEVPTPPQDLVAETAAKAGRIKLAWTASMDRNGGKLAGYEIQRSESGEPDSFETVATTSSASYVDGGLSSGQMYFYRVVAYDTDGHKSAPSNTASAQAK